MPAAAGGGAARHDEQGDLCCAGAADESPVLTVQGGPEQLRPGIIPSWFHIPDARHQEVVTGLEPGVSSWGSLKLTSNCPFSLSLSRALSLSVFPSIPLVTADILEREYQHRFDYSLFFSSLLKETVVRLRVLRSVVKHHPGLMRKGKRILL